MIQYKKILMTLALLLTAATGAWADETPLLTIESKGNTSFKSGSKTFGGMVTITFSNEVNNYGDEMGWYTLGSSLLTVSGTNGYTITSCKFYTNDGPASSGYNVEGKSPSVYLYDGYVYPDASHSAKIGDPGVTKIEVYGTNEPPIKVNPVAQPAANTKQWTFNQPGSDVVLTPIYAKAAEFATTGTESGVTLLKPAAAEGVIAGTTAPLIAEGTGVVAFAGTSTTDKQGTLMYAIGISATTAPDLDAADAWSTTVPTAEEVDVDGEDVHVWYYILGADAPQGEAATLDNTFDNTVPACLTVPVRSNKFDLTLKAANANTIDATQTSKGTVSVKVGDADAVNKTKDITNGKLEAIKMGSEVKLNTKAGYKFRKVEVKKKARPLTYATKEGAVTRIKFKYSGNEYYADFTYSNGSFTRTGGSNGYTFSGSWTMNEENGKLTMTANYNEMSVQCIDFVCTFYVDDNEYTVSSTGEWNYSFSGIEVNGTDITSQLTKVK